MPDDPIPQPKMPSIVNPKVVSRPDGLYVEGVMVNSETLPDHVSFDARSVFSQGGAFSRGEPGHERLSRFVYDMARRIESHRMNAVTDNSSEDDFLEELMSMFATAPVSSEYAAKLAFSKPLDPAKGTGPHKLIHEATGQWAYCGGRGLCRWCTEDVPE
jgi:hypothetical protein